MKVIKTYLDYFNVKYVNKLNRKASKESFKLQADMRQIGYSLQGAARIKQKYFFLIMPSIIMIINVD